MGVLLFIALLLWAFSLLSLCCGTVMAFIAQRISSPRKKKAVPRSISVLKPIKGLENGLRQNLQSFFELDYPNFELIFAIADPHDPARELVEELMKKNTKVAARLIVGGSHIGRNPKINNLSIPYKTAKYDLILISDSNLRVRKNYLWEISAYLKPGVGLVTSPVQARDAQTWAGRMEQHYLNTFLVRWFHLGTVIHRPLILGKSLLFRRSTFDRFGGLRALKDDAADDYALAVLMEKYQLKVVLTREPVAFHLGKYTLRDFWMRHLRWGRIRKAYSPFMFALEPLLSALGSGILGAFALQQFLGSSFFLVFFSHLALWCANDHFMRAEGNERISVATCISWLAFELLLFPVLIQAAFGNKIEWRGKQLGLSTRGKLMADDEEVKVEPSFDGNPNSWETQEIPIMFMR
jgi:ceramide glucosyltransferase